MPDSKPKPGLITEFLPLTDPQQMYHHWANWPPVRQSNAHILDGRILHSRYRVYRKARQRSFIGICYELTLQLPDTPQPQTQIVYARAHLNGDSAHEFAETKKRPLYPTPLGTVWHLPEQDITLWIFPNDPQLPHLPDVIAPERLRHHLPYAHLPPGFNTPSSISRIDTQIVHYYPEQRCTTRYQLHNQQTGKTAVLYGKTGKNDHTRTIYNRLQTLWTHSQQHRLPFLVPRPLAYHAAIHTIWLAPVTGYPLHQCLTPQNAPFWLSAVANSLAALHRLSLSTNLHHTPASLLTEVQHKSDKLVFAYPHLQPTIQQLLNRLAMCLPYTAVPRLLHGDFHLRQLKVHNGQLVFFDFDEFAQGNPLQDVASFIVDLCLSEYPLADALDMANCFYRAYRLYAPDPITDEHFLWYVQYQFLTKAYRFYRQQRPDTETAVAKMLTLASKTTTFFQHLFPHKEKHP